MKLTNWKPIALALALCVGMSGVALAQEHHDQDDQNRWNQHHDRDHKDRDHDRDHRDRDHDRYRNNNGRHGYYGNNNGYYRYPNGTYGRNPNGYYGRNNGYYGYPNSGYYGYPNNGYYGGAYGNGSAQQGYQYGLKAGQEDAAGGHSFRPTEHGTYKDGNAQFKSGYMQGYRAGYGRGGQSYGNSRWPWAR